MASSKARVFGGIVLVAVSVGLVGWALWQWRTSSAPSQESAAREPTVPALSVKESVVEHSEGGRLGWKLRVEEVEMSGGGATVAATGLKDGLIYDAQGRPVLRLTAAKAKYNTARKDFELTGKVTVVSERSVVITTERVQWMPEQQTLRCPGEVKMTAEDLTLTADHLDLIVPEDIVKASDRVRMEMGEDRLTGRNLTYNLDTKDFTLDAVQATFAPESAKEKLERLQ